MQDNYIDHCMFIAESKGAKNEVTTYITMKLGYQIII